MYYQFNCENCGEDIHFLQKFIQPLNYIYPYCQSSNHRESNSKSFTDLNEKMINTSNLPLLMPDENLKLTVN